MEHIRVSINILCLDTKETLIESIDVIREDFSFLEGAYEIIVIDNGSKEPISGYISGKDIYIIRNESNQGISAGKNSGIRASRGEYIILLDGDVVPVRNSLYKLLEYLDNNQSCQALGFMPNRFSNVKNSHGIKYHEDFCHTLFNPRIANTACLFYGIFRRDVFNNVMMDVNGPFGSSGYGWEDHDFFNQMRENNIDQWQCGMNFETGKYYHNINSSIRSFGYAHYQKTCEERRKYYSRKWKHTAKMSVA
jgi:glycosyltransferase involved in cell wall biosynthesis